jgi:hypothetical protein
MRVLFLALAFLPLLTAAQSSYDHYNDAYFTGDGSLPDLFEANGLGAKTSFGLPLPDPAKEQPKDTPKEESPGAKESQMQPPPPSQPKAPPEEPGSPYVEDEEDIVELLTGGGAISGVESLPGQLDQAIDFENYSSGGFRIVVDGRKVRDLFGNSVSVREVLALWKTSTERQKRGKSNNISTGQYYALIAATLAEDDARIDRAEFTHLRFEITYRSRGAMLFLIPWSFPVRVAVDMAPGDDRVTVRFPWYHWFLREYFTRDSLAAEVRDVIVAEEAKGGESTTLQVRLFVALSGFFKQKVRTVSDSVLLGS